MRPTSNQLAAAQAQFAAMIALTAGTSIPRPMAAHSGKPINPTATPGTLAS